jgi:hypothetical protein
MRIAIAAVAAVGLGFVGISGASAAPASGSVIKDTTTQGLGLVEKTEWIFGGHRHCWYLDGWHGPGWYWCGYGHRRGRGWGGPEGYQGWRH